MKCPYPVEIIDEASGIKVKDVRAQAYLEGYVAGWKDSVEVFYDEQTGRQSQADINPGSIHGTEAGSQGDGGLR